MTTVVTGASGFVGGNLTRALLAAGRPVRAVIYQEAERERLADLDVEIVTGDVRDLASLRSAFAGADVVYHLASFISLLPAERPLVEAINIGGAQNVVEASLACGVRRLVHFSSFHAVVQEPLDEPVDEFNPLIAPGQGAPYNWTKAAGEIAVLRGVERGLDAVIIRPTGIIGPNDFIPSLFGSVLIEMAQGRMPVLIEGGCDWVDVRDVVAGALRAEQSAPAGRQYLLSGHYATLRDIAGMVAAVARAPEPRAVVPLWAAQLYAPVHTAVNRLMGQPARLTPVALEELSGNCQISHNRAARELGYSPRPLIETIQDTITWFTEHGHLSQPAEQAMA